MKIKLNLTYKLNFHVLARYENLQHKPPSKLHLYNKGPFQVVNITGSVYTVRNLVTNKFEDYHITNLQPFDFDPIKVNRKKIANTDQSAIHLISEYKSNTKYPAYRVIQRLILLTVDIHSHSHSHLLYWIGL